MRYLILIVGDEKASKDNAKQEGAAGAPEDPCTAEIFAAYQKYNDDLIKAGVLLSGEALMPSSMATRISVENGKRKIVDGPFSEAKEFIGGYVLIQVKSKEEALEWAARCPAAQLGQRNCVELREIAEIPS